MAKRSTELFQKARKHGYVVEPTRGSHYKVYPSPERRAQLKRAGVDVDNFPAFVIVSGTPSDQNAMRQAARDFRKIGLTC